MAAAVAGTIGPINILEPKALKLKLTILTRQKTKPALMTLLKQLQALKLQPTHLWPILVLEEKEMLSRLPSQQVHLMSLLQPAICTSRPTVQVFFHLQSAQLWLIMPFSLLDMVRRTTSGTTSWRTHGVHHGEKMVTSELKLLRMVPVFAASTSMLSIQNLSEPLTLVK